MPKPISSVNQMLALTLLFLMGCAEDIPDPLTEEDLMAMLSNAKPMPEEPVSELIEPPERIVGKDGTLMALIPAGEFSMGDHHDVGYDDEKPAHMVYLDAYYIDVHEVTNDRYARFLNAYAKNADDTGHKLLDIDSEWCLIERVGNTYGPKAGYADHPVIEVSWYGATAYADWTGKRLPTEAEWEKAARGGLLGRKYPWGDEITHDDANYSGIGGKDRWDVTSPVGSFHDNGYGLYDVTGNVWEWCWDWYDPSYYARSPLRNPRGPSSGAQRILRGGSWGNIPSRKRLRVAIRPSNDPSITYRNYGFRCAKDVTP